MRFYCIDQVCQDGVDQSFVIAIAIPVIIGSLFIANLWNPPSREPVDEEIFSDPTTGNVFEGPQGSKPERDKQVGIKIGLLYV